MNTENKNEMTQMDRADPRMLAKRARKDVYLTGTTEVRCPKCRTAPGVETTPRGERNPSRIFQREFFIIFRANQFRFRKNMYDTVFYF